MVYVPPLNPSDSWKIGEDVLIEYRLFTLPPPLFYL